MIARLGNVLYWLACGIAGLAITAAIAFAVIPSTNPNDKPAVPMFFVGIAVVCWLVGRAFKYVLAGR